VTDQLQTTPSTGRTEPSYSPSPISTDHSLAQLSQLITPRSTASTVPLADHGLPNQDPYRKLISSKPHVPAPTPAEVAATALSVLTQPKFAPPLPWKDIPVEKGFVPVTIPPTFSHFLYLPVEIRKRIYAYLVHNGDHGLLLPKDMRAYHQAPITRVNRQIRSESIIMVYTENAFDAKNRELTKIGPSFARHIGDARLTLVRNWKWFTAKRHLFIDLSEGGSYQITYKGPDNNTEITAVALERATEVYRYLRTQSSLSGFSVDQVTKMTEIVLRITPKAKSKEADKKEGDKAAR
jgi:hypothetical protein